MDYLPTPLLVGIILFISTFVRSAFGFGDALIAMPLLALTIGIHFATPLVAFVATTIAITILVKEWQRVNVKAAIRLILSSLLGIPFGLFLLKVAPEELVKGILGLVLMVFGVYNLLQPSLTIPEVSIFSYIFGFFAGILGGAYNTNGPLIVIYSSLRHWSPRQFRATLQGYFLPTGLMILIGHGLGGLWNAEVVKLYLYALPIILLAIYLGGRFNHRLPREFFRILINIFLIGMGILFLSNWM